jgi:hypothetical protein
MSSTDSSSSSDSSSSENGDELNEFLDDLNYLNGVLRDNASESSNSEDSDYRRESRKRKRETMSGFYAKRKDVLQFFDEEKIRRTFRFDRASIEFITGIFLKL